MKLTNLYKNLKLAFKIKVTMINESKVSPSYGVLKPGESTKFMIKIICKNG
jgi:hypothetical protein